MSLSGVSLNAVTAPGAGSAIMFDTPKSVVSLIATATGGPTDIDISLQGTIDGTNWVNLVNSPTGTNKIIGSTDRAVLGIRAFLNNWNGGSTPTFTASVAAV